MSLMMAFIMSIWKTGIYVLKVVTDLNLYLFAMTGYFHVETNVNVYTVILFYQHTLPKFMSSAMLALDK